MKKKEELCSFSQQEQSTVVETDIKMVPIAELQDFEGHPFKVENDMALFELMQSIEKEGVIVPTLERPKAGGGYELIAGHRRKAACKWAGIDLMPVVIRDLDDNQAVIAMVNSNLQREHLKPSEKAFAYKLKMEAMSRQGQRTDLTSTHVVSKLRTNEIVGESGGDSRETVRRYIRLTELIPEILRMVDDGKIALTPAVELSYLTKQEQQDLLETMESEDCTPSLSQAIQMKRLSQSGELDIDRIFDMLREPKANQIDKISFRTEDLRKYFPKSYSAARIQETILKLLADYQKKRQRENSR